MIPLCSLCFLCVPRNLEKMGHEDTTRPVRTDSYNYAFLVLWQYAILARFSMKLCHESPVSNDRSVPGGFINCAPECAGGNASRIDETFDGH